MVVTFLNDWTEIKRKMIFHNAWVVYEIPTNKVLLAHSSLVYLLSMATYALQWQSRVVAIGSIYGQESLKRLLSGSFQKKYVDSCYTAVFIKMLSFGIQNIDNLSFSPQSVLWPEESRKVLCSCPASLLWAEGSVPAHVTGRHSTVFRKWPDRVRQASQAAVCTGHCPWRHGHWTLNVTLARDYL